MSTATIGTRADADLRENATDSSHPAPAEGTPTAVVAGSCCPPAEQASCCEPSAKAACCGESAGDGCGCR